MNPHHKVYQKALHTLLDALWRNKEDPINIPHLDMCIAGMLLSMSSYGQIRDERMNEIVNYLLEHQMRDGGWNCQWHRTPRPKISSVHTTLSVLEGLRDYLQNGYTYKAHIVEKEMYRGIEVLLERELFKSFKDGTPLFSSILRPTYPPRWKYDTLKALEFLASINYPFDPRMIEALDDLKKHMKGPLMRRGSQHSGLVHFKLEHDTYGRFNTLRMLKVLKVYENDYYKHLLTLEINV